jgi:CheY-like chemotaxis protein
MLTASDLTAYMGSDLQPGHYVMLRVSDNGIGMEPRTLSRIFDPFFSTKVNGHGLGLSATLGIIRTHRGGIHVQSQPDVGTTFTLLFPVAQQNLTVAPKPASTTLSPATNEQVVLIIDDEALVRDAIVDILQMDGFTVIAASGGEEGLAQFRQYQAQIGVVVLDMKMPGMSGEETFQRLRQLDAAIKIILSSGYNESQISRDWHAQGITAFLQKPYDFTVFTETIRKALLTTT